MGNKNSKQINDNKNKHIPSEQLIVWYFIRISTINLNIFPLDVILLISSFAKPTYACYLYSSSQKNEYISKLINNGYKSITSNNCICVQLHDHSIWNVAKTASAKRINFKPQLGNDHVSVINSVKCPTTYNMKATKALFLTRSGRLYESSLISANITVRFDDDTASHTSTNITVRFDVKKIQCGTGHSLFLLSNGTIWSLGNNQYGACGLKRDPMLNSKPSKALQLVKFSGNYGADIDIIDIDVCLYSNLCLSRNCFVYGFGKNGKAQLAVRGYNNVYDCIYKPKLSEYFKEKGAKIIQIDTNNGLSGFVTDDHKLYTVGSNRYGGIGNGEHGGGNTLIVKEPFLVSGYEVEFVCSSLQGTFFLTTDNRLFHIGDTSPYSYRKSVPLQMSKTKWGLSENVCIKRVLTSGEEVLFIVKC